MIFLLGRGILVDNRLWVASCVLIVLGLLFLLAGFLVKFWRNQKEELKAETTANVVELLLENPGTHRRPGSFQNCYYPVLEYYVGGKLYRVRYPHGSYPSMYHVGQKLTLRYDPDHPLTYRIEERNPWKFFSFLLTGGGIVCLLTGFVIFLIFAHRG